MTDPLLIPRLQARLVAVSDPAKKAWWEAYLKGVIPFRGVSTAALRRCLAEWRLATGLAEMSEGEQLALILPIFAEPLADDKLAGILYLQAYLWDRLPWRQLLAEYAGIFARREIFDWNICDWFCVRILGPTLVEQGLPYAAALAEWSRADYLWQARAAAVPFIKVAADRRFDPYVDDICARLIHRPERFAKTAVGWLLRDISRYEPALVNRFLDAHLPHFSLESARNATKYLDKSVQATYVAGVKAGQAGR